MRCWPVALALLPMLAACGGDRDGAEEGGAVQTASAESACSVDGAADWSSDCTLEREGDLLTVRHPDGGFRRFRILSDGRGLKEADGAEQVRLRIIDGHMIEATVGDDRYRLPAKIAGQGR